MKSNKFYQVLHGGKPVGFFRKKGNAKKYASQFRENIEGHNYKITVRELEFLDEALEGDLEN